MSGTALWEPIGRFDEPVPEALVRHATDLLFTPDPSPAELESVEVCIVLGSRNCGYKAERALEVFGGRPAVTFVACGGNRAEGGEREADLIARLLREGGVESGRVLIDDRSTNTADNLRHAERLLRRRGLEVGALRLAVVSSGFHYRHVMRSLPASIASVVYVNASGPNSAKDAWHTNPLGRALILHELLRPGRLDPAQVPGAVVDR